MRSETSWTGTYAQSSCILIRLITCGVPDVDDGDAGSPARVIDLGHGEAFDVVAPAREESDDPRQHAGLVRDEDGERVGLDLV